MRASYITIFSRLSLRSLSALVLTISVITFAFAQGIQLPQDYGFSDRSSPFIDAGLLWQSNTSIHPLSIVRADADSLRSQTFSGPKWMRKYLAEFLDREQDAIDSNANGLGVHTRWTLSTRTPGGPQPTDPSVPYYTNTGVTPELWVHTYYGRGFYGFFQVRATSQSKSLDHFSGRTKTIRRAGFNSAEVDQSLIGYQNKWVKIDFGRSREIWGAEPSDNLLLSGSSPPYERIAIQLTHKRFTYRWFHAYLETVHDDSLNADVQRYMYGRMLEYNNHKNLILNVGETVIYSGPNRQIDFSSLNPFSEHMEIETNKRYNSSANYANSIQFAGMDWLIRPGLRFESTLGVDEYKLERKELDSNSNMLLYFARLSWTPIISSSFLTFYADGYRIDTYSEEHHFRYDNNITHGQLIGSPLGNDADDYAGGLRVALWLPVMLDVAYGRTRWGSNSLRLSPYRGFDDDPMYAHSRPVPFPSGTVRTNHYVLAKLDTYPLDGLNVQAQGHFDMAHSGPQSTQEMWVVTFQYTIPYSIYSHDD